MYLGFESSHSTKIIGHWYVVVVVTRNKETTTHLSLVTVFVHCLGQKQTSPNLLNLGRSQHSPKICCIAAVKPYKGQEGTGPPYKSCQNILIVWK